MAIKFCVKAGKSAVETNELTNKVYGSAAMSCANAYRWYARFQDGTEDVKDDARSGHPSTARRDENVESVCHLLTEACCTTLQMIADRLNIGKETVLWIVTEDSGERKICATFVPHALTREQKQERVAYRQYLLLMGQDNVFGKISLPVMKHGVSPTNRPPNNRVQNGWGKTLQNQRNCDFKNCKCR